MDLHHYENKVLCTFIFFAEVWFWKKNHSYFSLHRQFDCIVPQSCEEIEQFPSIRETEYFEIKQTTNKFVFQYL